MAHPQDSLSELHRLFPMTANLEEQVVLESRGARLESLAPDRVGEVAFLFVLQGDIWLESASIGQLLLGQGSVILQKASQGLDATLPPLRLNMVGDGPAVAVTGRFVFDCPAQNRLYSDLPDHLVIRHDSSTSSLWWLADILRREATDGANGRHAIAVQVLPVLFLLTIRAWVQGRSVACGIYGLMKDHQLALALHQVLGSPKETWNLERLAAICGMSRATFARRFKAISGETPATLIAYIRMALARNMLHEGADNLEDIAGQVGYKSSASFSRKFKREFGEGPSRARRLARRSST